jgi:DNA-binding CsgD family transcriptional regulator
MATPGPDPDAVAYHFRQASDPRAVTWLVLAGIRAQRRAAWLSASARYTTAAALLAGHDDRARERGWLLFSSGQLLNFADNVGSLRALDEAEPLALAANDPALTAHIRFNRGRIRCLGGGIRRGLAEMTEAVIALDALPSEYRLQGSTYLAIATIEALLLGGNRTVALSPPAPGLLPLTLPRANLLNWLALAGHYREALALDEVLIPALLTALGGRTTSTAAAAHLGRGHIHAALGRPEEARREHDLAAAGHYTNVDSFMLQYTRWVELLLVIIPYQTDDLAERARLAADGAHAWERAGGTSTTATHAAQSDLPLALLEGRWAEARRLAQAGRSATIVGFFQGAVVALGVLARWQGEPALAWEQVWTLLPVGPATEPGDCFFPHGIAALALASNLALDAGDVGTAGEWVEAHGHWLDWSGAMLWQADNLLLRARHAGASGDLARSQSYAEQSLARASTPRQPLALLASHRFLGELDTAADRHADAAAHLDQALALAEACAAPYERALTLLALAELRWATKEIVESQAALATARGLLLPLDARPALARADTLAARLAFLRPAAYPAGLTAREVAVLRLVADGLSNREAADALVVSERTVERHLENLYRKIAARNRAEAVAYAIHHNLT